MAKRKKAQPWDAVFNRLRVIYLAGLNYPPKVTAAELDDVESELGFQFPLSYRFFAEQYGLGGTLHRVVELFNLRPRSSDLADSAALRSSVLEDTRSVRGQPPEYFHRHDRRYDREYSAFELDQLVAFGTSYDEQRFVFFPAEVTDAQSREYRIYIRDADSGLKPIAESFAKWLSWVNRVYAEPDQDEEPERYPFVFKPNSSRPNYIPYWADVENAIAKAAPWESDVKLWLSWNNNTVRDLARTIRDAKQTDAFPILADALQEAGCTNPDLLDSCRHGDPDIDGAWVLQILLGKA